MWACVRKLAAMAARATLLLLLMLAGHTALAAADDAIGAAHSAVDLTDATLSSVLAALPPAQPCIIEFYASWCPHCRHYAPHYEKAAAFFKAMREAGQADVFVGRLDCAAHPKMCSAYSVPSYPHLMLGTAAAFSALNASQLTRSGQLSPEHMVKKVNELFFPEKPLTFLAMEPPPPATAEHPAPDGIPKPTATAPPTDVWTLRDVESATRMLWHMIATTPRLHRGADKRAALLDLVQWWAVAHPATHCRQGARQLVDLYDVQYWPAASTGVADGAAPQALQRYQVCGGSEPWGEGPESWEACAGSQPEARGFTCGLWLLFHTTAARLPVAAGGAGQAAVAQTMVRSLRAFASHFFMCEVCQKHFQQVMSHPQVDELRTQRDAVMWLWRAHNEVNARLAQVEATYGHSSSGDPEVAKVQWPPPELCPECQQRVGLAAAGGQGGANGSTPAVSWREEQVYAFLMRAFGAGAVSQLGRRGGQHGVQRARMGLAGAGRTLLAVLLVTVVGIALLLRGVLGTAALVRELPAVLGAVLGITSSRQGGGCRPAWPTAGVPRVVDVGREGRRGVQRRSTRDDYSSLA